MVSRVPPAEFLSESLGVTGRRPKGQPAPAFQLREFGTYAEAQGTIKRLTRGGYPVERTTIVGTGPRSTAHVRGRVSYQCLALAAAGGGALFGLLTGLLLNSLSARAAWAPLEITGVMIGMLWGASFSFFTHRATGKSRDIAQPQRIEAQRFAILIDEENLDEAFRLAGLS